MSKKKTKENQETPFTRIPWDPAFRDRGLGHGDYVVLGSDGTIIAEVVTGMRVDAFLIAAAPALLAACEATLKCIGPRFETYRQLKAAIDLAKPPSVAAEKGGG